MIQNLFDSSRESRKARKSQAVLLLLQTILGPSFSTADAEIVGGGRVIYDGFVFRIGSTPNSLEIVYRNPAMNNERTVRQFTTLDDLEVLFEDRPRSLTVAQLNAVRTGGD